MKEGCSHVGKQWIQTMMNIYNVRRLTLVTAIAMLLPACASNVSLHNAEKLKTVDNESHDLIAKRVAIESQKMYEKQKQLIEELTKTKLAAAQLAPVEPKYNPLDAVKISVDIRNGDAQDLLRAIASQSNLNLLLDPELSTLNRKISLSLSNVPASQVFDHVMMILDLDGQVDGSVLIVRPYTKKVYDLDFLQSSSQMDVNMGGDVFGANNSASGGSSSSMIGNLSLTGTGNKKNDPYEQLEGMLNGLIGKPDNGGVGDAPLPGVGTDEAASVGAGSSALQKDMEKGEKPYYSLNRMTGTLFVKARPSQIKVVSDLVEKYKDTLSRQVLIEAQILDIGLNEQFNFGVDWSILRNDIASTYGTALELGTLTSQLPNAALNGVRSVTIPTQTIGLTDASKSFATAYQGDNFTAIVDMMQRFGTVRVLSNPILRAKNARPSFISVGRNTSYIAESTSTVTNNGGSSTTTSDVTTSAVFDGIILGVEPFIANDGKIHLTIHPMQSEVSDSSLALIDAGSGTKVTLPVVDFKGLTTSLSLSSGDTVVLGGLTDEIANDNGGGVPGLADAGALGALFGSRANTKSARELIIVLRVTRL
jgi:MSHA type pilus biogenesis protein MshL